MEKYVIEDLVIDTPEEEERREKERKKESKKNKDAKRKKGKKSSKGKYISAALISTALIALVGVGITLIKPNAYSTTNKDTKTTKKDTKKDAKTANKDTKQISVVKDPVPAKLKKDFIDNSKTDTSDANKLPKQKHETAKPKKQITQNINNTPLLENSGSTNRAIEENSATTPDDSIIIAKNNEPPKENQKIEKTTEVEKSVEQKPLKISDILSLKNSAKVPVIEEKKVSQPEVLPETTFQPEILPETVSQPEILPESEIASEAIPKPKTKPKANTKPKVTPKPKVASRLRSKPRQNNNNRSAHNAIMPEENTKSNLNTDEGKKESEANATKIKSTKKVKRKQNSFFDIFVKKTQYYIQVGTDPSSALLSKLENAKLKYLVTRNKGKYKTIVGPYSSMRNAKSAIRSIKKDTKINGILVKMKIK